MTQSQPSRRQIRRWRHYLADEIAERAIYADIAEGRTGEEREILIQLSTAEGRHADHWRQLLGEHVGTPRISFGTRVLGFLARRFGSVFVLAMAQRAEARSPYSQESDATPTMAADERIHEEVVRGLAAKGRARLSGTFRAAVFGANDGLISNLSLVVGVAAGGVSTHAILLSGVAGLLGGALSMGAGEYVSVSSQRELLEASRPQRPDNVLSHLNVNANELALVYRSRGMDAQSAEHRALEVLDRVHSGRRLQDEEPEPQGQDVIGTGLKAGMSSFLFFSTGAVIPILPFLFGVPRPWAMWVAIGMVGIGLLLTGAMVGLLSGSSPARRGFRQLGIGFGAAAVTYLLGLLFGA